LQQTFDFIDSEMTKGDQRSDFLTSDHAYPVDADTH
jgi:hypothetical protein